MCQCVARHSPVCRSTHVHHPWPLGMGGPDEDWNRVRVCPNTHASAHQLVRLWGQRYDGRPPGWVVAHFSRQARDLAEVGWTRWHDAGRPVDRYRWIWQGANVAFDVDGVVDLLVRQMLAPHGELPVSVASMLGVRGRERRKGPGSDVAGPLSLF